ncbi:MAG: molybdopterin molybdenumtransferase MoeA [Gemmatimonadota bacterium]|nr:MAG: molybdopterin molybdenumtransferase MoeA [Gemmatimonadota bacterium]
MAPFWKVITREEAEQLYADIKPLESERVHIQYCLDRVLGEDIISEVDVPHFPRSNMDGYAVRAEDTYGASESSPITLKIVGKVDMGKVADLSISPGEVAHIATGGMLPEGADAMVMVEYTEAPENDRVAIKRAVAPGEHIVSIGEDIKRGQLLLKKGNRLRAQDIGVLAAVGVTEVAVHRRPRVGILSTGDEIVPPEVEPKPGQVRGTNIYTLSALTVKFGGEPIDFGIVRDEFETLKEKIAAAIQSCDIVAISGGSSVGTQDITLCVIKSFEAKGILAHGVAIRPGKPTIQALVSGKPVIGLPGHPVSAAVVYGLLVKPIIYRLTGASENLSEQAAIRARLSQNVPSPSGREDYVRVTLRREGDLWWADPIFGKSGAITTLTKADGLVKIDLELEGLEEGQWVEVKPF